MLLDDYSGVPFVWLGLSPSLCWSGSSFSFMVVFLVWFLVLAGCCRVTLSRFWEVELVVFSLPLGLVDLGTSAGLSFVFSLGAVGLGPVRMVLPFLGVSWYFWMLDLGKLITGFCLMIGFWWLFSFLFPSFIECWGEAYVSFLVSAGFGLFTWPSILLGSLSAIVLLWLSWLPVIARISFLCWLGQCLVLELVEFFIFSLPFNFVMSWASNWFNIAKVGFILLVGNWFMDGFCYFYGMHLISPIWNGCWFFGVGWCTCIGAGMWLHYLYFWSHYSLSYYNSDFSFFRSFMKVHISYIMMPAYYICLVIFSCCAEPFLFRWIYFGWRSLFLAESWSFYSFILAFIFWMLPYSISSMLLGFPVFLIRENYRPVGFLLLLLVAPLSISGLTAPLRTLYYFFLSTRRPLCGF